MTIQLPGDKSISHRALIFASLAQGVSTIKNLSHAEDVWSTLNVLKSLGTFITLKNDDVIIDGKNLVFDPPRRPLNCGNAGTLMRLMMGVLCGQKFSSELVGDESLSARPMARVAEPLAQMGAKVELKDGTSPVRMTPSQIEGGSIEIKVPSAQVKSAVLFAGLYVRKKDLVVTGELNTRDHTERMFKYFGANIETEKNKITLHPNTQFHSRNVQVPNDISAVSFWLVYALLSQQRLQLENILLSPSRMGFFNVLKRSGAVFKIEITEEFPEVVGNVVIEPGNLKALKPFHVEASEIPSLVDEVPVMCLLASQLNGDSKILGAHELRIKESDRLVTTQRALKSLGVIIHVVGDDIHIPGNQKLEGGVVDPAHDHRIAMMAGIASRFATKDVKILNKECASISDPYFFKNLDNI